MHYITNSLHYITLHYITLHYITLHNIIKKVYKVEMGEEAQENGFVQSDIH